MMMPERKFSAANSYRYGFNGKENDNEVKGVEGSQQDYGMRVYDPRIGKFLSVDPITFIYPELTPYQFASNRPIEGIDLDGLEFINSTGKYSVSLYGLNKFKRNDKDYTIGNIKINTPDIHKIIENHPRAKSSKENPKEDDSTPQVQVVKNRRQDNKLPRSLTKKDVKNANKSMTPDLIGGLLDLVQWGKEANYDTKFSSELDYGRVSLSSLARADNLVRAASNTPSFPMKLNELSQLTHLVNYILDYSLPENVDAKYIAAIKTWGNLLITNENIILEGKYNFSTLKTTYKTVTRVTNQSDGVKYKYIIEDKVGNDDQLLKVATSILENLVIPSNTSVKQNK